MRACFSDCGQCDQVDFGLWNFPFNRHRSLRVDLARARYQWLQQQNIATVLDVGANTGQFTAMARSIFPTSMIYSSQPLDTSFSELEAKSAAMQPIQCFNVASGRKGGTNSINKNEFSASSSMLPLGERHTSAFPCKRITRTSKSFAMSDLPIPGTTRSCRLLCGDVFSFYPLDQTIRSRAGAPIFEGLLHTSPKTPTFS